MATVAVVYFAKPVVLPLTLALLLTVVISPAVMRLERIGVGRLRIGRIGSVLAERTEALGALSAWDEVVLPALGLLERDRQEQRLDPEQLDVVRETIELLLNELPEPEISTGLTAPAVLCLPAREGWGLYGAGPFPLGVGHPGPGGRPQAERRARDGSGARRRSGARR